MFKDQLPVLDDLNTPLSREQLQVLQDQVTSEGDLPSIQSQFNYSWGLIKSNDPTDQKLGIKTLTDLYKSSPQRRRECLYYLSLGCFKVGDYANARRYIDSLILHEPTNEQFIQLQKIIQDKIATDGLVGIALVSGIVAIGATALSLLLTKKKR